MTTIRTKFILLAAGLAALAFSAAGPARAAGEAAPLEHGHWHFSGVFGTYDKDALQRGFQVYEQVCAACHGLELVAFRNLGEPGGPFYLDRCPPGVPDTVDCSNGTDNPIVKAIAANYRFQVTDGPDESGEMFERAPLPSDRFPGPYANDEQARMANNGALPPDLSLITKARHHGTDYLYSLMIGYEDAPAMVELAPGQYYNRYFPGDLSQSLRPEYRDEDGVPLAGVEIPYGGLLAMPPPLADGMIDYADPDTPETVEQYAKDVAEFLTWAAEPKMEQRKALGFMTIIYLLVLAGVLYWSYRKIWSNIPH